MLKCSSSYKFRLFKTSHYQKISQANVYNRLRSKKIISTPLDKLSSERSYENLTKILRKSYEKFRSFVPGIFARADHFLTPRRNSRKQYFYVRFASTVNPLPCPDRVHRAGTEEIDGRFRVNQPLSEILAREILVGCTVAGVYVAE